MPVAMVASTQERARSRLWRWLATAFTYPAPEQESVLRMKASVLAEAIRGAWPAVVFQLGDLVAASRPVDAALRAREYEAHFGHAQRGPVPLHTTEYGCESGQRARASQAEALADMAAFHAAVGSKRARERVDHIAVHFEFLHVLAERLADAHATGEEDHLLGLQGLRMKYLERHMAGVVPLMLARVATTHGGFAGVARLAQAVLAEELIAAGLSPLPAECRLRPVESLARWPGLSDGAASG